MSRNIFRETLSNFHLADNTQIAEDRYYKVRVLFEKLNFNFKQMSITALMKELSLSMENTAQNNSLEESPLGLGLNFGASTHLKDISFMQNHTVTMEWILIFQILIWVRVQMLCWV